MNNTLLYKKIIRSDGTEVSIGDICYVYISKKLNTNIELNTEKNIVYINNEKINFINENDNYNISVFNNIECFEGLVDFENQ